MDGRGPTTRTLDLGSPWLLTTYPNWDDPPSRRSKKDEKGAGVQRSWNTFFRFAQNLSISFFNDHVGSFWHMLCPPYLHQHLYITSMVVSDIYLFSPHWGDDPI